MPLFFFASSLPLHDSELEPQDSSSEARHPARVPNTLTLRTAIRMSTSKTAEEYGPLSRAIRTGDADTVRRLLDEGAKPSFDDVHEAQNGEFPEVCKVLITAGLMDVNEDFEHAGDLLINMVWELKLRRSILLPHSARLS